MSSPWTRPTADMLRVCTASSSSAAVARESRQQPRGSVSSSGYRSSRLDRYFWAPGLIPMPRQEWIEVQQRLAAADHATSADVHIFRAPRQLARFIAQLESYEPPPEARPASC
ncbi:MAG: hypothetical protein WKF47_11820 [Geodermatophilaceae bacterium]